MSPTDNRTAINAHHHELNRLKGEWDEAQERVMQLHRFIAEASSDSDRRVAEQELDELKKISAYLVHRLAEF